MIATMTDCRAKATIAFALVLASISSASAQSHDWSIGPDNFALSYQDVMSWGAAQPSSVRVQRRVRRAPGRVPNVGAGRVMRGGDVGNPGSIDWYERNREELRGRW
jgi:hypothetical protein